MRSTTFTFDPAGLIFLVFVVLLIVGVIPFTAPWVGGLLIGSEIHMPIRLGH